MIQHNFNELLMYNGCGKAKAKEIFGTLDDIAMTYDEAVVCLEKEEPNHENGISAGTDELAQIELPDNMPESFIMSSGVGGCESDIFDCLDCKRNNINSRTIKYNIYTKLFTKIG